ncbi:Hypothetical predicted protein [Olea europaea subsp. europaea]|uniref:Uncharacterized protein n=1 Tax=Olea europaea subsp. europaea TaxID=158383 RepID=A0A8S0TNU6_OLEEU|nr:Hypothetical predicted protein [Olea europaea subsp. europaea]
MAAYRGRPCGRRGGQGEFFCSSRRAIPLGRKFVSGTQTHTQKPEGAAEVGGQRERKELLACAMDVLPQLCAVHWCWFACANGELDFAFIGPSLGQCGDDDQAEARPAGDKAGSASRASAAPGLVRECATDPLCLCASLCVRVGRREFKRQRTTTTSESNRTHTQRDWLQAKSGIQVHTLNCPRETEGEKASRQARLQRESLFNERKFEEEEEEEPRRDPLRGFPEQIAHDPAKNKKEEERTHIYERSGEKFMLIATKFACPSDELFTLTHSKWTANLEKRTKQDSSPLTSNSTNDME